MEGEEKMLFYRCFLILFAVLTVSASSAGGMVITGLSVYEASPDDQVEIQGYNFGDSGGYVVLTGLRVPAIYWSDELIRFEVPESGAGGWVYVRRGEATSNRMDFSVVRELPDDQFFPYGFELGDWGLAGAAFLVETDGEYLYGLTGFERLATYRITEEGAYEQLSRLYLPQRVGDLRLHDGYLYIPGDHGLYIYRCSDLQSEDAAPVAVLAGGSYLSADIRTKEEPVAGTLAALCEYKPRKGSTELRVHLFRFASEELEEVGIFTSETSSTTERRHAAAIDPLNPKVYVSGYGSLFGEDKYILEIDFSDPESPVVNHREETGKLLAFDMDTIEDRLWTGVCGNGTVFFRAYGLLSGEEHLELEEEVTGIFGFGRTTRVKVIDEHTTVGCAWCGARPDVMAMKTFDNGPSFQTQTNSVDWAFDVSGFSADPESVEGKIVVADEWAGFLTYDYRYDPEQGYVMEHEQDCRWVPAGAMTEGMHINGDRLYIADRGAGAWSADRFDLSNEQEWRWTEWDWNDENPQPYPVSALCTRHDPVQGTLIAALAHEKAMAWGHKIYGILYRETAESIVQLAISEEIDPPGLWSSGISAVWPETDLIFMTTGTDGVRAYVADPGPEEPAISLHADCPASGTGFGTDYFSGANMTNCMKYYGSGEEHKLIIGTKPNLFVADPTLYVFNVSYPEGIPDRDFPDRKIEFTMEYALECTGYKTVNQLDVTPSGLIAVATSQGLALFHISWIPVLNNMPQQQAWELISVPNDAFQPWRHQSWNKAINEAAFADDADLYCVKSPYGVWKLLVEIDWQNYTHECSAEAFYPGVQCGMDYNNFLHGWTVPELHTLHHPYCLQSNGDGSVYVSGWSGKVYKLNDESHQNQVPSLDRAGFIILLCLFSFRLLVYSNFRD